MYKIAYRTRRGGHTIVNLSTMDEVGVKIRNLYNSRVEAKAWVDDETQPGGRLIVGQVWKCAERGWLWFHATEQDSTGYRL